MTETNGHVIVDVPYQGNAWWIVLGLGSLFILYGVVSGARSKRKAGLPVDTGALIFACIFFLSFFALAVFQVLSHL